MKFSLLKSESVVETITVLEENPQKAMRKAYESELVINQGLDSELVEKLLALYDSTAKSAVSLVSGDLPYFVAANFSGKIAFVTEYLSDTGKDGYANQKSNVKVKIAQADIIGELFPDKNGMYRFKVSFQKEQFVNAFIYGHSNTHELVQKYLKIGEMALDNITELAESKELSVAEYIVENDIAELEKMTQFIDSLDLADNSYSTAIALKILGLTSEATN